MNPTIQTLAAVAAGTLLATAPSDGGASRSDDGRLDVNLV